MDRYSRWVSFLKVLLPLTALGLLSTLFLVSRGVDPEAKIPFAEQEIADRLRQQQVTAPFFSGVSDNGNEVLMTATTASPAIGDKPADAQNLYAKITTPEGATIKLNSDSGTLGQLTDIATFSGNVVLETSTGYVVLSDLLTTRVGEVSAQSPGAISGTGPLGTFSAGQMQMDVKNGTDDIHMLFKNGVKLIYDPKLVER